MNEYDPSVISPYNIAPLVLLLLPVLSIALVYLVPARWAKYVSLASSLSSLGYLLYALNSGFLNCNCYQWVFTTPWVDSLGINFAVGMNGLSMIMMMLTNIAMPFIVLSSFSTPQGETKGLHALMLFMQASLLGVFLATDSFLFYLFYEAALIPVFFIILNWGGENKGRINLKFFIYTLAGSLLMLLAIIYLYLKTGSFSINAFYRAGLTLQEQTFLFIAFMAAFAVKIPLFPFHSWQPQTYTVAPTQGTMLLSAIMLKMALYGILRFVIPIAPLAVQAYGHYIIILAVIGVIYGAWIAINQNNIKTLFAFSSLSHVGLITAGLFTLNFNGMQGATFQMFSHGINAIGLFMVAEVLQRRTGSLELSKMGGIVKQAPVFAVTFFVILLGAVALPLTSGFIGEFLILLGLFEYNVYVCGVAGITIILGAVYMLNAFQKAMLGNPAGTETENFKDLNFTEAAVLVPIAALIIFFGIQPEYLTKIGSTSVDSVYYIYQQAIQP